MKPVSKSFLSVMLLLSTAAVLRGSTSTESTRSTSTDTRTHTHSTKSVSTGTFKCGSTDSCSTGSTGTTSTGTTSTGTTSTGTTGSTGTTESVKSHRKDCSDGHEFCQSTLFLPHPQYLYSDAAYWNPFYYDADMSDTCFSFGLAYRFRKTFHENRIAECLFGTDKIILRGSKAIQPDERFDFIADNVGLAPNFRGTIRFDPEIQDHMIDISSRMELGSWFECLDCAYFSVNGTVVHTRWDLNACATVETATSTDPFAVFPTGYVGVDSVQPTTDIKTAFKGDYLFGEQQTKWPAGKFRFDEEALTDTKLANVDIILGYDFLRCDTYHLGLFLRASAPTGTRPTGEFVFEPIIGNGHHWEFGGGLDAHCEVWSCDDQSLSVYLNGSVEHLFKDDQFRLFDLKSKDGEKGCLSRYLLFKSFNDDLSYSGQLVPGTHVLHRKVESKFNVQGDAALRLLYRNCGWALGLGYGVYGRSEEDLSDICKSNCEPHGKFGVKGTTGAYALRVDTSTADSSNPDLVLISATQSDARITSNFPQTEVNNPSRLKDDVAWDGTEVSDSFKKENDKPAPVLFDCHRDLAIKGVPRQISHRVFAHIDYQWEDCEWQPWVGLGGSGEFAQNGKCHVCTANFWSVWLRTGVSF